MQAVTLPRDEYEKMQRQALAYQKLASNFFKTSLKDSIGDIVSDFRKTGIYSEEFLKDLDDGLKKSSYAKSRSRK